jgi:adenylate cyclase
MRRWMTALAIGLFVGLAGALFFLTPWGVAFERSVGLPWLFKIRGSVTPPDNVVVVAMDGRTGEQLDLPSLPRDWPRSIHARLVNTLVERGAAVIVFDVHFGRMKDAESDQALVDAVARAGNVLLVELLTGKRIPITDQTGRHVGMVWAEDAIPPFEALAQAASGVASFPLPKAGASVDQFWAFKESADQAPSLPAMALQLYGRERIGVLIERLQAAGVDVAEVSTLFPGAFSDPVQLRNLMRELHDLYRQAQRPPGLAGQSARWGDGDAVPLESALEALYAGESYRFLNFYGPPGSILNLPYHAVLAGSDPNVSPEALDVRGKVVFVGYADLFDPGQPDRFYTVFTRDDGVDLSGVEIAATAFANLLTDRSLRLPSPWVSLTGILLFGVLMGATLYLLPAIAGVPLAIAMAAGFAVAGQLSFNQGAVWLPFAVPMLLQFPLALFIGLVLQYLLERGRVKHISEAMSYYLPESVHRELTARALDPASINRVVFSTCLATDMSGFSTVAEQMKPGELAEFLNDYFDSLAQPLKRHGVDVTEFRADAIMCAWTGDSLDPSVRKQPILASLEAAEAIAGFKDRHQMAGAKLRIGMETGEVYVGHAGGGGHFVYSIVGDSANTASRIEGLNKHVGTQILATRSVTAGFGDDLLLRDIGRFRFVGKTGALPIVEVLSRRDNATPAMIELCERFAEALDRFDRADWKDAAKHFEAILGTYPQDGPSGFYLDLCNRYLKGQAPADDPGVINMTAK